MVKEDSIEEKMDEIKKMYDNQDYDKLYKEIDFFIDTYSWTEISKNHQWYKDFINWDIYKEYLIKSFWKEDRIEEKMDEIKKMYDNQDYDKLYKEIDFFIDTYSWTEISKNHQWYKDFINWDIYKEYLIKKEK